MTSFRQATISLQPSKTLFRLGPNTPPETVEIAAGAMGRYRVTFVARQNPDRGTSAWFWGLTAASGFPSEDAGAADELKDPDWRERVGPSEVNARPILGQYVRRCVHG